MARTFSITMPSMVGIMRRAPAADEKGWFFFVFFLPVLHFLSGSKWVYIYAWGDTFLPYTWNVARREPTVRSPLPNFTLIAAEIWEYSPQHCQKFGNLPTNVPLRGDLFAQFFYEILSVCTHLYVAVVAFGDKQPTDKHFPAVGAFSHTYSIAPSGGKYWLDPKKFGKGKMTRTSSITMLSMAGID